MSKSTVTLWSVASVLALSLGVGYGLAFQNFTEASALAAQAKDASTRSATLEEQLNGFAGARAQLENDYTRLSTLAPAVPAYQEKLRAAVAIFNQLPKAAATQDLRERLLAKQELLTSPTLTAEELAAASSDLDGLTAALQSVLGGAQAEQKQAAVEEWVKTLPAKLTPLGSALPIRLVQECLGTALQACHLTPNSIGVLAGLYDAPEDEQLFALASAYAQSVIAPQLATIEQATIFKIDFNSDRELLASCMAATKGVTLRASGCTPAMLAWAGEVWNGRAV